MIPLRGKYKTKCGNTAYVIRVKQDAMSWVLQGGIEDARGVISLAAWDTGGHFHGPNSDYWSLDLKSPQGEPEATA